MSPMWDGRTNDEQTREDRATQPMDAGWLSFAKTQENGAAAAVLTHGTVKKGRHMKSACKH